MINFILKTNLKAGEGEALKLREYLGELKLNRVGVIIDSNVLKNDYAKKIIPDNAIVWEYVLIGEPDYDSLDKVKLEFQDKVDCFVAIGGGSVIDFAKGLATLVVNPGNALDYRGFPKDINPSLPVIAIPTTAGTASEVTYNAVFIDLKGNKKLGINTTNNFPILAILDPNLIKGCPSKIIAYSGMDALVHILESYVAVQSNQITKMFAREAFRLVFNNLGKVFDNSSDIEAIMNLQLGAYLAGISLMNSGSGPAGALSYTLGVNFKVPHGLAGAIFIPYIVRHNIINGYDYSELGISDNSIFELCEKLGIPKDLKILGVNESNIHLLYNDVDGYEKAFNQNPIPFTIDNAKELLKSLI